MRTGYDSIAKRHIIRVYEMPQPEYRTIEEVRISAHLGGLAASALECFYGGTISSIDPLLVRGQLAMICEIARRHGARLPT